MSLSGHTKVTGEITQLLMWVDVETAEIPKSLFHSFMLSVTVTSRESNRFSNSRVCQGLPGMHDGSTLKFHLEWNRILLPSHFRRSYSALGYSEGAPVGCRNGNIVAEENLFLVALISNESPPKGKLGGINTTCAFASISLFSGGMFHSDAQGPHLGEQLPCTERIRC